MNTKISIDLPYKNQVINIEDRAIHELIDEVSKKEYTKKILLLDEGLLGVYADLDFGSFENVVLFDQKKTDKNLKGVFDLMENIVRLGPDRHSCIVSIGGGTIGDVAGYIAAQYMRGIDFIQLSTSLMSMVDCIIGKVGVNSDGYKNVYGSFNSPNYTYLNLNFLKSINQKMKSEAISEVLKHYFITDSPYLKKGLNSYFEESISNEIYYDLILGSIGVKKKMVEEDPFDMKSIHAALSYGHTFANGLESLKDKKYTHGEAVLIGMLLAADISLQKGIMDLSTKQNHDALCFKLASNLDISLNLNNKEYKYIMHSLKNDKMSKGENIHMVLLKKFGEYIVENEISERMVVDAFERVKYNFK